MATKKTASKKAASKPSPPNKATSRKVTPEKATSKEATSEKATSERAPSKKAISEKATPEKAIFKKATSRKAASGKAAPAKAPPSVHRTIDGHPTYPPPVYSPAAGKQALASLRLELASLPETEIGTQRLDVETATYAALGVAGFLSDPEVHARFARLPPEEFDLTVVTGLAPACFATLHALAEARAAGALRSDARVPPDLAAEAAEVEARMQTLCEYHFKDDPEISPELTRLCPGHGHRDLANDLLGYARIYELRAPLVQTDPKHYRPTDLAEARRLAGRIIQSLSAALTPRARTAHDTHLRTWTLLRRRYDEVRAAALWLYRHDPTKHTLFPSLYAAARPNSGRPKKTPPGTPPASKKEGTGSEEESGQTTEDAEAGTG